MKATLHTNSPSTGSQEPLYLDRVRPEDGVVKPDCAVFNRKTRALRLRLGVSCATSQ